MDSSAILKGLNEKQTEAVLTTEGYVRVAAGAGSGKTRALTERYAYLIEELGVSPANILCITFTNKAAREMKSRLRRKLGDGIDTSFISTLHSFCVRVLKEDIGRLFYPENFVVLDTADQKSILEEVYEELGIKMDTATFEHMIGTTIRTFKNKILYDDYMADPREAAGGFDATDTEKKVIVRYMEKQKKYFGLDFFDIINFTVCLFKKHEDVLNKWQNRLHYVMFDEFQDTNTKEFRLVRVLSDYHQNLFVVGDPDQNIYEWRAALVDLFVEFDKFIFGYFNGEDPLPTYWPDHVVPKMKSDIKTIMLNENYRSTPQILNAANSLIVKNKNRMKKELFTKNADGETAEHFHAKNETAEIDFITEKIERHVSGGGRYSDCAVLYRSAYVSRFIEQGLLKRDIPYVVYGGVGFYERKEIKDVLSYLRLAAFGDDLSFNRIANVPRRKISKGKIAFIKETAEKENALMYDTLKKYLHDPVFKGTGAAKLTAAIEEARERSETEQVSEILQRLLIDTGYEQYVRESGEMERLDNVTELLRSIAAAESEYGDKLTLPLFLQEVSLNRDSDEEEKKDCVKIMTVHIAKGLEFPVVFVAGMSEKIFPSGRSLEERLNKALEEERRLCYVAMTRAKLNLYLTESEGIGVRGQTKTPSRFLFDIDDKYIKRIGSISAEIMDEHALQTIMRNPWKDEPFPVGTAVKHKVFGEGVVEEADALTETYSVRFLIGVKPIRFDFKNMWRNV
ncbi:MAG: ATP-dependent helicase [Defluviitaleaceae bacterium]|nr:ATP-dependent helicase [Defluviitaleaceae bacterium]